MHIDSIDLMIFIGGIIINSLCCVAAGSVESDLIFAFCYFAAATEPRMWKNWLTLSSSESPDLEFIFVKATLAKREAEERSPGRPRAPIPRL